MLTADERALIRELHDEDYIVENDIGTLFDLIGDGYAQISLTNSGLKAYNEIMKSGDGPEHLKEMFRI